MKKHTNAFTLVELVVVTTIIAILSAVGFVAYTGYIDGARDTNRISQLSDIRAGLEKYNISSRLPYPDGGIEISASGALFAYQGSISKDIAENIGYQGAGGIDPKYDTYPLYMLSQNRRDFQLMTFLEKNDFSFLETTESYANIGDYSILFPKTLGSPLGILLESDTQTPLHLIPAISSSGDYDVVLGTESLTSYLSDGESLNTIDDNLQSLIPNQSCKRILDMGKSSGSKEYIINPTGSAQIRVYCDMETDGGGWTFFGHVNQDSRGTEFSFESAIGDYLFSREDNELAYALDVSQLAHNEMMVTLDSADPQEANTNSKIVFYKYEKLAPGFYTGPLPCSGLDDTFYFKTDINTNYDGPGESNVCNSGSWYTRDNSGYLTLFHSGTYGNYWGASMGGDNTWSHDGWWYVR